MNSTLLKWPACIIAVSLLITSCKEKKPALTKGMVSEMKLKRGDVITCGTPDKQFGTLEFPIEMTDELKSDFNLAVKMLHSFEYDEAEKVFARVIDRQPDFAMAYWGVAMSNFHPLWTPPTEAELVKGAKAVELAQSLSPAGAEKKYIDGVAELYKDYKTVDHKTRCLNFEKAMQEVYRSYPDDKEAATFYSLSLIAAADPNDKTFARQKKAGEILNSLYPGNPNHPGIVHYIIHTYDAPELADKALEAARKYASVAPSSAHALHMPSHIFTRMGIWDECILSNQASVESAKCYAESAGIKGHWDEELHALDYLVYAYLQRGDNEQARKQLEYLSTITEVSPMNFKVAYAFAAMPARYVLENKLWKEAADLKIHIKDYDWKNFPWQKAIVHFTRLLGNVHLGDVATAKMELEELRKIQQLLLDQKDAYKANQIAIQVKSSEAWIAFSEGKRKEALQMMEEAASMEDKTEKHPVTPSEVVPARELLGDMLMEMNQPEKAFEAYTLDLLKHPNRFNALYGAGMAAKKSGNVEKAQFYFAKLLAMTEPGSQRKELKEIKG